MQIDHHKISINGYTLSRKWWTFAAENVGKVTTTHTALFYYIVELWNLLGQAETFGLPKQQASSILNINPKTFNKAYNELIEWGFLVEIKKSTNQFVANVVQINGQVNFTDADAKAHTKAILEQRISNYQSNGIGNGVSNGVLIEPLTINHKPLTKEVCTPPLKNEIPKKVFIPPSLDEVKKYIESKKSNIWDVSKINFTANKFFNFYESKGWMVGKNKMTNWRAAASNFLTDEPKQPNTASKYDNLRKENRDNFFGTGTENNSNSN